FELIARLGKVFFAEQETFLPRCQRIVATTGGATGFNQSIAEVYRGNKHCHSSDTGKNHFDVEPSRLMFLIHLLSLLLRIDAGRCLIVLSCVLRKISSRAVRASLRYIGRSLIAAIVAADIRTAVPQHIVSWFLVRHFVPQCTEFFLFGRLQRG